MAAIANVLRVAAYNDPGVTGADDLVAALACEIDDMTGEELAAAADHLRACDGVLDVSLFAGTGKGPAGHRPTPIVPARGGGGDRGGGSRQHQHAGPASPVGAALGFGA